MILLKKVRTTVSEKLQKLVQQQMLKRFGERNIMSASDLKAMSRITYGISIAPSLDLLIGRPGFPAGRLTEICAPEGSAKSTHAYHILAETQRLGGIGVLLETEQAFEADRLSTFGIDTTKLMLGQPDHLEQAFDMMDMHITLLREKGEFQGPLTIVLDSVAGCPSASEVEKGYDEKGMGAAARVISQSLRKLTNTVARHKVVLVFLNQLKSTMNPYGDPFESYGGKAIKYHASLRLQLAMRKSEIIRDDNKDTIGTKVRVRAIKNKLAMPFREADYTLNFQTGIDLVSDSLQAAVTVGYIDGKQGRYTFKGNKFQTRQWPQILEEKFGGIHKFRERLNRFAIAQGFLKSYNPEK
jgi:recombination protein RecA